MGYIYTKTQFFTFFLLSSAALLGRSARAFRFSIMACNYRTTRRTGKCPDYSWLFENRGSLKPPFFRTLCNI